MAFVIQAHIEDHTLSATTETAKEAFGKAVEWQVVHKLTCVTVSDGIRSFSITDFASAMAFLEIANTVGAASDGGQRFRNDEALSNLPSARSSAIPYAGRLGADPQADPRG
jgi:hypothetical protein